jgi:hypothetical protein
LGTGRPSHFPTARKKEIHSSASHRALLHAIHRPKSQPSPTQFCKLEAKNMNNPHNNKVLAQGDLTDSGIGCGKCSLVDKRSSYVVHQLNPRKLVRTSS